MLASKTGLKLKSGDDEGTLSAQISKDEKAILYFSRGGAGAGGINVTEVLRQCIWHCRFFYSACTVKKATMKDFIVARKTGS